MYKERHLFLSMRILPARLNAEQTAWLLGFNPQDIPVLIRERLLKPLGHPSRNASKYFPAIEVEKLKHDVRWLGKASDAVTDYWRCRNENRNASDDDSQASRHQRLLVAH